MDDSSVMRERVRPQGSGGKSSILALLDHPGGETPRPQAEPETRHEADRLPKPGDAYLAHARPSNQVEPTLFVMGRDGYLRGFAWSGYDGVDLAAPEHAGGGPVILLRFDGLKPVEVVIEGRNLSVLISYLGENRVAWIREQPAGQQIREDAATVISRITFRPIASD